MKIDRLKQLAGMNEDDLPSIDELIKMFNKINDDVAFMTDESVVPLTDVDYYANQISNIYGIHFDIATRLATEMSKRV